MKVVVGWEGKGKGKNNGRVQLFSLRAHQNSISPVGEKIREKIVQKCLDQITHTFFFFWLTRFLSFKMGMIVSFLAFSLFSCTIVFFFPACLVSISKFSFFFLPLSYKQIINMFNVLIFYKMLFY